jgi:PBP1b-binding outer membrane lipoprotein LpoB
MSKFVIATAALAIGLSACASQYKQEEKQQQAAQQMATQPVNCATAPQDLQTLQNEKVNASKQAAAGASAVVPIGLVGGMLTGTEKEKGQVATGRYNEVLDQAITHIKTSCNIP